MRTVLPTRDRAAYLRATPNPVPVPIDKRGRTTLAWDTADGTEGHLFLVSRHGTPTEHEISMAAGKHGRVDADWIRHDVTYRFRLYRRDTPGEVLAETTVTTMFLRREVVADVALLAGLVALAGSTLAVLAGALYVSLRGAAALGHRLAGND